MKIDGNTKLTAVLGYPLSHSLSPLMHNEAFKHCSFNCIYIPLEVKPEDLGAVVKAIGRMNFIGFNVTVPHKVEVMKYLDEVDKLADIIGAVNTVVIKDGKMKGYNTDGIGFLKSLEESTKQPVEGRKVFILGAGGACRAISMTLAMNKAERIYICNRTYERAESLCRDINANFTSISLPVLMEYENMKEAIEDSDILINTTTVGMYPHSDESPLPKSLLKENLIVCDIVYNPKKTKLLKDAEALECKIVFGLPMLVYQGAEAFKLWTGIEAPVNVMFKAVESNS